MANLFEPRATEDGTVYETVKVTSDLKKRLLDEQDDRRRRTGRRQTMSSLIEEGLNAISRGAARPAGTDTSAALAEMARNCQDYEHVLVNLVSNVHSVMQQLEELGITPRRQQQEEPVHS